MVSNRDIVDYLNLGFTIITTLCALYITYVALQHGTKPKIKIILLNQRKFLCDNEIRFKFKIINVGYWYARPMVVNLVIYCNFDENFKLKRMEYGSRQELVDDRVKKGKGEMNYFKASGIMVGKSEIGEEFHVETKTPSDPGCYLIRLSAYSDNGVSYGEEMQIECYEQ